MIYNPRTGLWMPTDLYLPGERRHRMAVRVHRQPAGTPVPVAELDKEGSDLITWAESLGLKTADRLTSSDSFVWSESASVSQSGSAWGPGPNEPSGFTTLSMQPCTVLPPYSNGSVKDAYGWYCGNHKNVNNYLVVDAVTEGLTAPPYNGPTVWKSRTPNAFGGGGAPVSWTFNIPTGGPRRSIYRRNILWIPLNFDCNGNTGTKGQWCQHAGGGHYLNQCDDNGSHGHRTSLQSPSNNYGNGLNYGAVNVGANRGRWVEFESLWQPGSGGSATGIAKLWVAGQSANGGVRQLQDNISNAIFWASGDAEVFTKIMWETTYGGGSNPAPYEMFIYIAGSYISASAA